MAFALIGDLSLLHDAPGLAIGPGEPRPDLCVVVVNNDGGGIFEGLEPARFGGGVRRRAAASGGATVFERVFGTPHGASLEQLAAAFGLPYTLAERPGDLAKALAAAGRRHRAADRRGADRPGRERGPARRDARRRGRRGRAALG